MYFYPLQFQLCSENMTSDSDRPDSKTEMGDRGEDLQARIGDQEILIEQLEQEVTEMKQRRESGERQDCL